MAEHRTAIADLCRQYGVAKLALFGSAADGRFRPGKSDVDFLYELIDDMPGSRLDRLMNFANALELLLGAPVDLVYQSGIRNPYFAAEVARTRVPIYG